MIPARPNPQRQKVAIATSVPAPVLGLNAKDDIAAMDPRYALTLTNVFPEADRVAVRRGYGEHGIGMTDPVESVMAWRGPTGVKILAATENDIWNATSSGTATSLDTTPTSGRWQDVNITTSGGHYLLMFNGADTPKKYDGSSVTSNTITGTGLTSSNLIHATSHKERVWMIENNTMNAWYLGTRAITGAAVKFPLGAVFKEGGYLMAAGTYSDDAGNGIDDYLAFISSVGEVLLYQGTDPASANTWSLAGRFRTGTPLGRRCLANLGGDLLILTDAGVISMKAMLKYDRAQQEFASVSDKIDPLIIAAARDNKDNFGWQIMIHPRAKWLVLNVPLSENESQYQFVMNTLTGAWCDFDGYNANCFVSTGDNVYFGGNAGIVYEADSGYQDDDAKIDGDIKTAYNYFDSRGTQKHFTLARPVLSSTGAPGISFGVSTDFEDNNPTGDVSPTVLDLAFWGTAEWSTDVWGGISYVTKKWTAIKGVGMCMAFLLRITIRGGACSLNSFDVLAEPGGVL